MRRYTQTPKSCRRPHSIILLPRDDIQNEKLVLNTLKDHTASSKNEIWMDCGGAMQLKNRDGQSTSKNDLSHSIKYL